MGNFKEIKGNLLDLADKGEFDLIIHGCNCQNIMGAGIALQIRKRYPQAYERDTKYFKEHVLSTPIQKFYSARTSVLLGNFSTAQVYAPDAEHEDGPLFTIINAYTQILPGANFELSALVVILKKINLIYAGKKIGIPLIGAGIGGGDWSKILLVIKQQLKDCDVTIVHFDPEGEKKEGKEVERRVL